jgi:hypothetical protein
MTNLIVQNTNQDVTKQDTNPFTTGVPALTSVSDKYRFIPTSEFIRDLQSFGYKLESTTSPRRGLGMHSMVFSHPGMPKLDGIDLRLLATNSHDATSAFRIHLQVGVGICANVLVSFLPGLASHSRIIHRGYAVEKVAAAVDTVRARVGEVINGIEVMSKASVNEAQLGSFLFSASQLRDAKPWLFKDLAKARHLGQAEDTAWNVFNRVQESLVKGGYRTQALTSDGRAYQGNRAKAITAVRERVTLNYKLWELATKTLLS